MIGTTSSGASVDAAWEAFDAAAITFQRMYDLADPLHDTASDRARRMAAGQEVARLWDEWRVLFLAASPRPAV